MIYRMVLCGLQKRSFVRDVWYAYQGYFVLCIPIPMVYKLNCDGKIVYTNGIGIRFLCTVTVIEYRYL